jgi:hypothetical protein
MTSRAPAKVATQLRHRAWPRTDTSSDQATRQGRARSRPLFQEANGRADGCFFFLNETRAKDLPLFN